MDQPKNQHLDDPKCVLSQVVDSALMARFAIDTHIEDPGQIIGRLSERQRAALTKLKPEDIQNVRWPLIDGLNLEKEPGTARRKREREAK
jgi:hypothetical protein